MLWIVNQFNISSTDLSGECVLEWCENAYKQCAAIKESDEIEEPKKGKYCYWNEILTVISLLWAAVIHSIGFFSMTTISQNDNR